MRPSLQFQLLAAGFALGAGAHLAALLVPGFAAALGSASPGWRHALFATVDGAFALGLLSRPPVLAVGLALLLGQQLSTHGLQVWRRWSLDHRVDWPSLAVLIFISYALVAVVLELHARRAARVRTAA